MRIAVWHDLPSGGGKLALYEQVAGLLARGHEIESWCTSTADQSFLSLGSLVPEHIVPMASTRRRSVKGALRWASNGAAGVYSVLQAIEDHTRRCATEIDRGGFDLLLAASSVNVGASPIGRHVHCPSVLYLQEPRRPLYEAFPEFVWAALPRGRPGCRRAVRRCRDAVRIRSFRVQVREEIDNARAFDRLLANSYFSRESILRAYGIGARVCYLGVDTSRFVDRHEARERMIVGIGAFRPHKRVDVAIKAVASLPEPRPVLTWIGNAEARGCIRQLSELADREGVSFRPLLSVPHAEVVDVLNRAAVMLYAPRLEPFGYAPLEAGACGLPVVAKAEGGVRESVVNGETGILVDDDSGLGPAIARLLADGATRDRLGAAARRHVESVWSLGAAVDRIEMHLTEVAALS